MRNFKELIVWQKAHTLCLKIYEQTKSFPQEEKFGLISQLRRASSSIPTNIAEGCGHKSNNEFRRFINISAASASEVEYLLILSKDLNYFEKPIFDGLTQDIISIKKMLYKLSNSIPNE